MRRQRIRIASRRRRTGGSRTGGPARLGAAAVEFAIVANILFIMVLTCMEFARMNMVRNLAQDAAYYAARHAMVPGATATEAQDVADDIMGTMLAGGYTVSVSNIDSESSEIAVTVDVDLHTVALFAPFFLPDATIGTTATMRTERYDGFYQQ